MFRFILDCIVGVVVVIVVVVVVFFFNQIILIDNIIDVYFE